LELRQVETTLGMALAKTLRYAFTVRVAGAEVGLATSDALVITRHTTAQRYIVEQSYVKRRLRVPGIA